MNFKFSKITKPNEDTLNLIRRTADRNESVAKAAMDDFVSLAAETIRQGVLVGDILDGVFQRTETGGVDKEFPLDLLAPGEEGEFNAYTCPANGMIPYAQVEGDYVKIPTFRVANSIDWLLRYAKNADFDVIGRCMQIFKAGFVKKMNDDGFHTLLTAGYDRNILIYDADATAGFLSKRLVSLLKVAMRRNGGGNTSSLRRRKLTDLWVSPEAMEDIRNWNVDQVDEITRREIFLSADGGVNKIFGVNLHDLDELGEGQEYQLFFSNTLGGTMGTSDLELVIGLDLDSGSFLMPIKENLEVFNDPALHRQQKAGVYGWLEYGAAVLDSRDVILGSL